MRAQAKRVSHEEEEESAFVSMTDMTVGFLFIMMILLAFFASQMMDQDAVSRDAYDQVVTERDEWRSLAEDLETRVARLESQITDLRRERDALLEERDGLARDLASARADIEDLNREVQSLRDRIDDLLEQVQRLQVQIAEKDREIQRLEEKLEKLQQVDPLEAYLARVAQERRDILRRLRDAIRADFPELEVELSEESDALRFQGEGLFESGRSTLTPAREAIVARLAERLDEVLPCFTLGDASEFAEDCNPGFVMVEAVQIEGHTDSVGSDRFNRTLSAARANTTFFAMTGATPGIMEHRNLKQQPVLSVAAYGPDRPVTTNDTQEGRATNRRIDLRFIMVTPQDTNGIEAIREALRSIEGTSE